MVDAWKFSAGSSKLLGSCGGCSSGRTERSGWKIIMDCFSLAVSPNSCVCVKTQEEEDGLERKSLIKSHVEQVIKIKDVLDGAKTLAFHLEPKVVLEAFLPPYSNEISLGCLMAELGCSEIWHIAISI